VENIKTCETYGTKITKIGITSDKISGPGGSPYFFATCSWQVMGIKLKTWIFWKKQPTKRL